MTMRLVELVGADVRPGLGSPGTGPRSRTALKGNCQSPPQMGAFPYRGEELQQVVSGTDEPPLPPHFL